MKSDLYGAFSVTKEGSSPSIFLWHYTFRKQSVDMYRQLISDYVQLVGDERVFAQDKVDFLFAWPEVLDLLQYLTRHDECGDRHTIIRAEDPMLERLRQRTEDEGYFELDACEDWPYESGTFGLPVVCTQLPLST